MKSIIAAIVMVLAIACKDDHVTPIDAPPVMGDVGPLTCDTSTAYLTDCTSNAACMGCMCRAFGHDMYCTKACTAPTDCPAPSSGCVNGFCRRM